MLGKPEKSGAADSTGQLSWCWWSSGVPIAQWKAGCSSPKTLPSELNLSIRWTNVPRRLGSRALWGPATVAALATTAKGGAGSRFYPAAFTSAAWGLATPRHAHRPRPHLTPSCSAQVIYTHQKPSAVNKTAVLLTKFMFIFSYWYPFWNSMNVFFSLLWNAVWKELQ